MLRRITILLIVSAFVVAVHSDVLKCYVCTSLTNEGCNSTLTTTSLQPVECTVRKMVEWQTVIKQHRILKSIVRIFEVDETPHLHVTPSNMACAKTIINVHNQEVTLRMCQTAKTESLDPCFTMEKTIWENQLGKMEQCELCLKDACNGMTAISPEIFYTLLSFLGALIHVAFYHWA
ncbi:Protein quiver [Camponotus japonicus]